MSRTQWLLLGLALVAVYLWATTAPAATTNATVDNRVAQNTANVLAQNAALNGSTGYYDAGALGYTSPFAASSDLAGATLYVDIRPNSDPNNLPAGSGGYYSDFH